MTTASRSFALSRRSLLGTAITTPLLGMGKAIAAPPAGLARQTPGFHRRRFGSVEVTAILDGFLDLPLPLFDAPLAESERLLAASFLVAGPVATPVSAFLLQRGDETVLVDAGTQPGFAPGLGFLPDALRAAGTSPEAIRAILLTHLHPDHAGGLVRDGQALFPNAEVFVPDVELQFWTDDANLARADVDKAPLFAVAREAIAPYRGRLRPFRPGQVPIGWIEAVPLPGHTPGHTGYALGDGADRLLIWGDIVHAAALQFPRPATSLPALDTDAAAAAATRRRAFDRVTTESLTVAGMHLPFPSFGHVARDGEAFRFIPVPWLPVSG